MRRKKENCLPIKHAGPKAKQAGMEEREREKERESLFDCVFVRLCVAGLCFFFDDKDIERKLMV